MRSSSALAAVLTLTLAGPALADPIPVKVFIAAMFEIGQNTGDRPGEFQNFFERYWTTAAPIPVKGALKPVYCDAAGICGGVLGMGKVNASASMQAILVDSAFDFSKTYFILSGVGGTPPERGTIGDVSVGTWLVDYDLGHRWAPEEGAPGAPTFMPRAGYEADRLVHLDPQLAAWAVRIGREVELKDSAAAQAYRQRYPQAAARAAPSIGTGTHVTGDTFFHGPGKSKEAQYIAKLYGADDYVITEMENIAITTVIRRQFGTGRVLSLRGAVNFDQGNPNETTLQHLDPAPGHTAGGFSETVSNIAAVGTRIADHIVADWAQWKDGVPPLDVAGTGK